MKLLYFILFYFIGVTVPELFIDNVNISKVSSNKRVASFTMTLSNTYNSTITLSNINIMQIEASEDIGFFELRNTEFAKLTI